MTSCNIPTGHPANAVVMKTDLGLRYWHADLTGAVRATSDREDPVARAGAQQDPGRRRGQQSHHTAETCSVKPPNWVHEPNTHWTL